MDHKILSIRAFIGAKDFKISRQFYTDIGFDEVELGGSMSYFKNGNFGFYLQDYYAKEWVDNTMVFVEVDSAERYWRELSALNLPSKYDSVRLVPVRTEDWGKECFLHDPSGVLWHFGEFSK